MSAKRMPIPEHSVIAPEEMAERIREILMHHPAPSLVIRADPAPHRGVRWAGKTHVPFLSFCLEGGFQLPTPQEDHAPFGCRIDPGTGVLFCQDSFVNCYEDRIIRYLRMTFDRDGTLFGLSTRRVSLDRELGEGDLHIAGYYLSRPRSSLADALLARLQDQPPTAPVPEMFRLLLHELARHLCDAPQPEAAGGLARFQAVHRYLEEHCHLPINRETTARAFGVSPETLSRDFAAHSPSSFKRTLLALRLERARALLKDPLLTVEDVALRSGFTSLNYFSDAFRRATGLRPSQWRNRAG